jgi:hypothetical protein
MYRTPVAYAPKQVIRTPLRNYEQWLYLRHRGMGRYLTPYPTTRPHLTYTIHHLRMRRRGQLSLFLTSGITCQV